MLDPQDPTSEIKTAYAVRGSPIISDLSCSGGILPYRIWRSAAAAKSNKNVQHVADVQFTIGEEGDVKLSQLIGNVDEVIDSLMLTRPIFKDGKVVG
jgi:hypothetical protein